MPGKTRAQIQAEIDALTAAMDSADTDDEVWIKGPDGHEIKVSGQKATKILGRYAALWADDDDGQEQKDGDGQEDADTPDPEPGGGSSLWRGRKTS